MTTLGQLAASLPFADTIRDYLTSGKFWAGFLPPLFVLIVVWWRLRRNPSHSVTISIPFGLGSWSYDTSPVDRIVAWKMHVQLMTRKAALPFDPEHDLVCDVYDSLFELFRETRDLLLGLPPREFERPSGVATLILKVQNDGIRPHLTRWQADFRKWWERAGHLEINQERSPQQVQREYPGYDTLVADLQRTNTELQKYADELLRIAKPDRRPSLRERLLTIAPWPGPGEPTPMAPTLEEVESCGPTSTTDGAPAPAPMAPPPTTDGPIVGQSGRK